MRKKYRQAGRVVNVCAAALVGKRGTAIYGVMSAPATSIVISPLRRRYGMLPRVALHIEKLGRCRVSKPRQCEHCGHESVSVREYKEDLSTRLLCPFCAGTRKKFLSTQMIMACFNVLLDELKGK